MPKLARSLHWRYSILMAGLVLIGALFIGTPMYLILKNELYSSLDDSLRLNASQAIDMVDVDSGNIVVSEDFDGGTISVDLLDRGLTIRILDMTGHNVKAVGPYKDLPISPNSLAALKQGDTSFVSLVDPVSKTPIRYYLAPITDNGQTVGAVQVFQTLTRVQSTLFDFQLLFLITVAILVLLAGIGGNLIARRILYPIEQIIQSMRQISADGLSRRIAFTSKDQEIEKLVITLDNLLARLDDSFKRERQFTADASHELRTPLTAMQTIITTTLGKPRSKSDYIQALNDISAETSRLQRLAQNLLLLARIDTNFRGNQSRIDLSTLIEDVVDSMSPSAELKGLAIDCRVGKNLYMTGDADAIIRLFFNLIDNAIKYSMAGTISIMAEKSKENGSINMEVKDTGIGISPEHLSHIFDRFYRADQSRSTQGIGLGLAIVSEIVRVHHGSIQVSSQLEKGTTFSIKLPSAN
jgi:heavy metal sensor kinase